MVMVLNGLPLLSFPRDASAQQRQLRWLVQAGAGVVYYHHDFGYQPGLDMQIGAGRQWSPAFATVLTFGYAQPRQHLLWLGETHTATTDWYRGEIALRLCAPEIASSGFHFAAELQAGWVHLQPHALVLNGGAPGKILLAPKSETRFSPGGAGMLSYRLTKRMEFFLQFETAWMKIARRQLNAPPSRAVWKPCQKLGGGVMIRF